MTLIKNNYAQNIVELPYNETAPAIDGKLDEPVWNSAVSFSDFKTIKPTFGQQPSEKTLVKMYYNKSYIFIGVICYVQTSSAIKASLSSRDNALGDDWAAFCLDTFNDNLSAYYFAANPLGIQCDGTLDPDANSDSSPDYIWQCAGNISDSSYTIEFAIPFETLRFPGKDELVMGFKVARQNSKDSEEDDYPEYNPEKGGALTQFQKIKIRNVTMKKVLDFIPAFTFSQPYGLNNGQLNRGNSTQNFSMTAKAGLASDITLDATYNPDFSQVETDAGQIDVNLRYSLYYPEKRPFFLEGKDLLGFSGKVDDYPLGEVVNTRSITKPKTGIKLTGSLFSNDKFYFLYALDDYPGIDAQDNNIPGLSGKPAHVSVFRYAKIFNGDNYLGGFLTSRNFFDEYNYVSGFDGRLRMNSISYFEYHAFESTTRQHQSDKTNQGAIESIIYHYKTNNIEGYTGIYNVSKDFSTNVGYITRTGITTLPVFLQYRFNLNKNWIYKIEPYYYARHSIDQFANIYEGFNDYSVKFTMPLQTVLNLSLWKGNEIYESKSFNRDAFRIEYSMEPIMNFNFYSNLTIGKFVYYNSAYPAQGKGKQFDGGMNLQLSGYFRTGIEISYSDLFNNITGSRYFDETIYSSNTVIQFNEYLYFRGILEYNDYQKQMNVNLLISFAYIPGTVIYLGYGSEYQKEKWENERYLPAENFMLTGKEFFFKASYLIKM
jgi:hypothetical protein